jgi:hypothetical protein
MARFSLGVRTSGAANASAAWEIRCSASTRARLMELGVTLAAATASTYGLGRPAAIGLTPTAPVDFQPEDPADIIVAGLVQSALAWATGPTVPANFHRRIGFPATIGSGILWTWQNGLVIPAGGSIVLWNLALNGVVDAYAVLDY